MAYSLTWLPDVLLKAGLKIAECPGWQTRGRGDVGKIAGIICHHTANPNRANNMPTLNALINGRADPTPVAGPLAHLGLGRDGTFYIIAAGKANHAGAGTWQGITAGNTHFIGIEAENTGAPDDSPWPAVQLAAYYRGVAAILKYLNLSAQNCIGHKEWAPKRKIDPDLDMPAFRVQVAKLITGGLATPVVVPFVEPGNNGCPTLGRGLANNPALVKMLQAKLGVNADGIFGGGTEEAVKAFQRAHTMAPDGIVGPKFWALLDTLPG